MTRLERLVFAHNQYWSGKASPLTDSQYDQEILWLKKEFPDHWILTSLGKEAKNKVKHKVPMLSLDKAYTFEEVKKFIDNSARDENEKFICQIKYDGLAAKYSHGVLATRGNGEYGEDITGKLPCLNFVMGPYIKPYRGEEIVDFCLGEIVCSMGTYKKHGEEFKHPRNFVIGMIGRKGRLPKGVELDFVEYKSSPSEEFTKKQFNKKFWEEILATFDKYNVYPKDGLVIKVADKEHYKQLGHTSHHPLGTIAYKFKGDTATASLISVDWQVGKDKITPVANISPTELNGVIIKKVTIHNFEMVKNFKLQIGDKLTIERSGDVIPHLLSVEKTDVSGEFVDIKKCPVCHSEITLTGPNIFCANEFCPGKFFSKIMNSIKEFEIEFIGDGALNKILLAEKINSFSDLLSIGKKDLVECGIGEKVAGKIFESIKTRCAGITPERFLAALNIAGAGRDTWKDVLKSIPFERLTTEKIPVQELVGIEGIGELTARKIRQGLCLAREEINRMLAVSNVKSSELISTKTICFTGKMPEVRSYYENIATKRGYSAVDGVTKELTLLVSNDLTHSSSKLEKAKKLGVQTVSLEDWLRDT